MSAWVVSKKHVDLMVSAVVNGTRDGIIAGRRWNATLLGQMLVSECVVSVSYRYPDDDIEAGELPGPCEPYYVHPYIFEDPKYRPTAAELYKAVQCYAYQSCEHPGWKASDAKSLCDLLTAEVERKVPEARRMRDDKTHRYQWAEYEAAPWGFDEYEIARRCASLDPEGRQIAAFVEENPADAGRWAPMSDWLMERGVIVEPLDIADAAWTWFHIRLPEAAEAV